MECLFVQERKKEMEGFLVRAFVKCFIKDIRYAGTYQVVRLDVSEASRQSRSKERVSQRSMVSL